MNAKELKDCRNYIAFMETSLEHSWMEQEAFFLMKTSAEFLESPLIKKTELAIAYVKASEVLCDMQIMYNMLKREIENEE